MDQETEKSVLILGLGNLLLGDEGVGVHVVRMLERLQLPTYVDVLDGGTAGFELLEYIRGKSKVIIIDCLRADAEAGSVVKLSLDELSNERYIPFSAHEGGVWELLNFIPTLTPPPEIVVYGIVPSEINRIQIGLSPAIESQMSRIISKVVEETTWPFDASTVATS